MSKTNIIYKKSLKEYFSKYGKNNHLIKIKKSELGDFNKNNNVGDDNTQYALKGKRWWLIGDTYYEAPSKKKKTAFASLALLLLAGGSVTLGVGQGVYHWFGGGGGDTPTPGPEPGPVPPVVTTVNVTFNAGSGYWGTEQSVHTKTITVNQNSTWATEKETKDPGNPKAGTENTTFKCWSLDGTSVTEKRLTDQYKFTTDVEFSAVYTKETTDPFETDNWANVIAHANAGFDELLATYRSGNNSELGNTFVGCERVVTLKNDIDGKTKDYKVRVIDEQADSIVEGGNKYYSTLTFEFEDIINYSDDFKFGDTSKYEGSELETALNPGENGYIYNSIVTTLESNDSQKLTDAMKTVSKKTHSSSSESTKTTKLFVPSLSELGVKDVESSVVEDEGYTYNYYTSSKVNKIKNKGTAAHSYWLRSDVVTDSSSKQVWSIGDDGAASQETCTTNKGVAPCFCLGKSENNYVSLTYSLNKETGVTFSDGTTTDKQLDQISKNTIYSDVKKSEAFKSKFSGGVPTCLKASDSNYSYVFKYWQIENVEDNPEISDNYAFKLHNTVLTPVFEKIPLQARNSICISALTDAPVSVKFTATGSANPNLSYITGADLAKGKAYSPVTWGTTEIILDKNEDETYSDKLYICSTGTDSSANSTISTDASNYVQIKVDQYTSSGKSNGQAEVSGDLRTLLDYKNASTKVECPDYCFYKLFGCDSYSNAHNPTMEITGARTGLTNASDLTFNFTTIGVKSFQDFFSGSTSLITGPKYFSPTILKDYAYNYLFCGCLNLNYIPVIADATTNDGAYNSMFLHCEELEQGPDILASVIGTNGLASTFKYCKKLTRSPTFGSSMTFTEGTQQHMNGTFIGCTELKYAPKKLPATSLGIRSYHEMFLNCTNLVVGPEICATNTSHDYSSDVYTAMEDMFEGCTKLNYLKVHNLTWGTSDVKGTSGQSDHKNWLLNARNEADCVFECSSKLEKVTTSRNVNTVPDKWIIKTF